MEGVRGRLRPERFNEHVSHAQLFWNSLSQVEQQHIIEAAQFELGRCDDRQVQERNIMRWNEVDHDFAVAVAEAFDIEVPQPEKPNHNKKTDGAQPFSLLSPNNGFSAVGRRIGIFALDGFDSLQVSGMVAAVTAIGSIPNVVRFLLLSSLSCARKLTAKTSELQIGTRKGPAFPKGVKKGDQNASGVINTNFTLESARSTLFDALFIPDGDENFVKQLESGRALHWIREATGHFKTSSFTLSSVSDRKI